MPEDYVNPLFECEVSSQGMMDARYVMLYEENASLQEDLEYVVRQLRQRQPKRSMTTANRETVEQFKNLRPKHKTQADALRELVTLPSEQHKKYVCDFQASFRYDPERLGYMEPVRNHVKRLLATDRKGQDR